MGERGVRPSRTTRCAEIAWGQVGEDQVEVERLQRGEVFDGSNRPGSFRTRTETDPRMLTIPRAEEWLLFR